MRIEIDTSLLPEGTTEEDVRAAINSGLSWSIDQTPGEPDPLDVALHDAIPNPFSKPLVPKAPKALSQCNSRDLTYLRKIAKNDHNDHQQGWAAETASREKLEKLGLVTVTPGKPWDKAAHSGDPTCTVCSITKEGREALRR